jgi:gliding motility-associated-like protein
VVNFTNTTVGGNKYLWDFGDGKTSTDMNPNHIFNTPGIYTVSLTVINTNGGCTVTTTKNNYINVYPNPIAEFTASTYTITSLYNEVYFNNNSKNASSYLWSFGDNSNSVSTEQNTSHTYDPTVLQNYVVTLIAKNEYGCVDTTKTIIKMTEDVVVFVPNAFTPDGDEFNNTFIPTIASGIDSYQYELFIYNRWGEVIFESHDAHVGWDGTFQGQICQDGSYTWLINLKKASVDSRVSKFGSVTLLR